MCFGGDDAPEPVPLKEVPSLEEMRGFMDEVFGVEMRILDDPSGKGKIPIQRRLKRTPERQMMFEAGTRLFRTALKGLEQLHQHYPQALAHYMPAMNLLGELNRERREDMQEIVNVPDFDAYVKDFTSMQERGVEEDYQSSTRAVQEKMNRTGYSGSTAANEAMAVLEGRKNELLSQIRGNAPTKAAQLRESWLGQVDKKRLMKEGVRTGLSNDMIRMFGLEKDMFKDQMALDEGVMNKGLQMIQYDDNLVKGSGAGEMAFKDHQMTNDFNLRANAQENQNRVNQFNMEMQSHQAQGPSFGDMLLQTGLNLGGSFLGAGMGSAGAAWGKQLFNNWGAP